MPEVTHTSKLQSEYDEVIFSDANRETIIDINHISMEFNMASEKLNSLKEYAIALLKRKLFFESFLALDDISFEVKKGDVFGILGTNGSGKSTLLKIIAGVLEPTSGSCNVVGSIAPLIELGAGFDMELSARENIYLNGSLLGYSKEFIDEHFDAIVDFAEISKFLDMPMKNYSSGMVARIAFAIATATVPDVLIVDEVLAVGDFMFQKKCEDRISDLISKHDVTVLIVSHSNDQIERLCNKAVWIEKGHIRLLGESSKVCDAYRLLGGRSGDAQSENYLFSLLKKAEKDCFDLKQARTIEAENHLMLASKLAWDAWKNESDINVVLVPDYAKTFSVLASGIAGYMNAPILPFDLEDISGTIFSVLSKLSPKKVFILAFEEDVLKAKEELENNFPKEKLSCEVCLIPCERDEVGLICSVMDYGSDNAIWREHKAYVVPFKGHAFPFIAATIAFKLQIPIIVVFDENVPCDSRLVQSLSNAKVETIVPFGAVIGSAFAISLQSSGMNIENTENSLITSACASEYAKSEMESFSNACISSVYSADWQNLITVPSYSVKKRSVLYLIDPTDLDSKASNIKLLDQARPTEIDFVGKSFSDVDKKVIEYATKMKLD